MRRALSIAAVTLALALGGAGCGGDAPVRLRPDVLRTVPHDPEAYTQGFLFHEGRLFESSGGYGNSNLREVDPRTGAVLRSVALADSLFAEGLAQVGNRLIVLTWKEEVALVYDLESFELLETIPYEGHGWGLCHDGSSLFMTNGSENLYRRDPATFRLLETLRVTSAGQSVFQLNELECVGSSVFANVFMTDRIVEIDKRSGRVISEIDAGPLSLMGARPPGADAVLNGIAWNPETETFLLTGKRWSAAYEVRFVPR